MEDLSFMYDTLLILKIFDNKKKEDGQAIHKMIRFPWQPELE